MKILAVLALHLVLCLLLPLGTECAPSCAPTPQDEQGPFYKANAPQRSAVGSGYLLRGQVLSARSCQPLVGAKLELWLAGPDGRYDDRYRATLFTDALGRYRFSSHLPVPFGSRPPHIHLIVNAAAHQELVTQFYPGRKQTSERFDIVLVPVETKPR